MRTARFPSFCNRILRKPSSRFCSSYHRGQKSYLESFKAEDPHLINGHTIDLMLHTEVAERSARDDSSHVALRQWNAIGHSVPSERILTSAQANQLGVRVCRGSEILRHNIWLPDPSAWFGSNASAALAKLERHSFEKREKATFRHESSAFWWR